MGPMSNVPLQLTIARFGMVAPPAPHYYRWRSQLSVERVRWLRANVLDLAIASTLEAQLQKRPSRSAAKTSAITRGEARKAVLEVKAASRSGAAKRSGRRAGKRAPSSLVERYLGHFGVGHTHAAGKRGSTSKRGSIAKRSGAKKSGSASKGYRRAS